MITRDSWSWGLQDASVSTAMQLRTGSVLSCTPCTYTQMPSLVYNISSIPSISNRTQQPGSWTSFRCQTERYPGTFSSAHRTLIRDVSTKASRVGKAYRHLSSLTESASDGVTRDASCTTSAWRFCTFVQLQYVPRCGSPLLEKSLNGHTLLLTTHPADMKVCYHKV